MFKSKQVVESARRRTTLAVTVNTIQLDRKEILWINNANKWRHNGIIIKLIHNDVIVTDAFLMMYQKILVSK